MHCHSWLFSHKMALLQEEKLLAVDVRMQEEMVGGVMQQIFQTP